MAILDMPVRNLIDAWESCVKAAMPAKIAVEDEITKSIREHVSVFSSLRIYCTEIFVSHYSD